ncbi:MAG: PAS domain-containing protein [Chitinivibrionales bacterium]|nr:PAS domain-containing protein [Chitinivibrionales bacterium]MBD3395194.1 PAS domain-containing protein [Chitinivibrionales bacterium]
MGGVYMVVTAAVLAVVAILLVVALVIVTVRYRQALAQRRRGLNRDTRFPERLAPDIEEKIRLSKKQLETTLDAIADYICVISPEFRIIRVNRSYADHVGKSVRDVLGEQCYRAFLDRGEPCADCPARITFENGASARKSNVTKRVGNEQRVYEVETYSVSGGGAQIVNVIERIRDVTDERRMNEQLMRSEKLASIGIMTAGIAHEMNNPLSGISGTAVNLLKMPAKYGLNEKGLERMTMILECAARATMIMKDLLRFSQKQDMVRMPTDMAALIPKAASSVHIPGTSRITRIYDFPEDLPRVRCDPSKIEQVIVNVITNATQAILEKRRSSGNASADEEKIHVAARHDGNEVRIDIEDNGIGIPADMASKIFDPFFTTRSPGEGTGLGLSICHRIVEEHQGRMSAGTKEGLTTISIILPVGTDPWNDAEEREHTRESRDRDA